MIESNLVAGEQSKAFKNGQPLEYGKSITYACVDLAEARQMFRLLSQAVVLRRETARTKV